MVEQKEIAEAATKVVAPSGWKLFTSGTTSSDSSSNNSMMFATKLTLGLCAMGVATYLLVCKYNGKDYLMSLRSKSSAVSLDQRCAAIKKKIDTMWKKSLTDPTNVIVHQELNDQVLRQFEIDFVVSEKVNTSNGTKSSSVSG